MSKCRTETSDEQLFRTQALKATRYRWFGPVQLVAAPGSTAAVLTAVAACGLLAIALVTIEIPQRITAIGLIAPEKSLLKIRAQRSGRVEQLSLANGDYVGRGEMLLRIADPQHSPEQLSALELRVTSLNREIRLLDQALAQDVASSTERAQATLRRRSNLRERIGIARAELEARGQQAKLHDDRTGRLTELLSSATVAEDTVDDYRAAALQAEADLQQATQQLLLLRLQLDGAESQLRSERLLPQKLQVEASIRREALLRQISASKLQLAEDVVAPEPGVVAGLQVRNGSHARGGQVLLTLHDPDVPILALLYISADSSGVVRPGQRLELQLHAFPNAVYGTWAATVRTVSAVALPAEETASLLPVAGPVFEIRAELDDSGVDVDDGRWQLRIGTTLKADLIRQRWPLYRWLIRASRKTAS